MNVFFVFFLTSHKNIDFNLLLDLFVVLLQTLSQVYVNCILYTVEYDDCFIYHFLFTTTYTLTRTVFMGKLNSC